MYEMTYNLFVTARLQAVGHARAEHQHDRRGAGLELVHQPDRHEDAHRRRDCRAARSSAPRPILALGRLIREKTSGVHPGFTAKDAKGETWFLEFDPPYYPEGATGRRRDGDEDLLGARLQPGRVVPDDVRSEARSRSIRRRRCAARPARGRRSRATTSNAILEHVARRPDGTYRVVAGRLIPGKIIGNFRYRGHASRRSQRSRSARAPPRAAGAARLRRVDEPDRLQGGEHARHARSPRTAARSSSTICRTSARPSACATTCTNGTSAGSTSTRAIRTRRRLFSFGFALSPWQTVHVRRSTRRSASSRAIASIRRTWRPQTPNDGLHGDARRRCVLGGAARRGLHRRADPGGGPHRRVQRSRGREGISATC